MVIRGGAAIRKHHSLGAEATKICFLTVRKDGILRSQYQQVWLCPEAILSLGPPTVFPPYVSVSRFPLLMRIPPNDFILPESLL